MRFWKAFIKVTLGTVMPREEARLASHAPTRAKREEPPDKPETITAAAPERVMQDIVIPERLEDSKTENLLATDQTREAKPKKRR